MVIARSSLMTLSAVIRIRRGGASASFVLCMWTRRAMWRWFRWPTHSMLVNIYQWYSPTSQSRGNITKCYFYVMTKFYRKFRVSLFICLLQWPIVSVHRIDVSNRYGVNAHTVWWPSIKHMNDFWIKKIYCIPCRCWRPLICVIVSIQNDIELALAIKKRINVRVYIFMVYLRLSAERREGRLVFVRNYLSLSPCVHLTRIYVESTLVHWVAGKLIDNRSK